MAKPLDNRIVIGVAYIRGDYGQDQKLRIHARNDEALKQKLAALSTSFDSRAQSLRLPRPLGELVRGLLDDLSSLRVNLNDARLGNKNTEWWVTLADGQKLPIRVDNSKNPADGTNVACVLDDVAYDYNAAGKYVIKFRELSTSYHDSLQHLHRRIDYIESVLMSGV